MKEFTRRDFLKTTAALGAAAILPAELAHGAERVEEVLASPMFKETKGGLIVPPAAGLPITGTFLDEISHDIPHQNWGEKEWDADFANMKAIGIDTVIMIRSGYRKFITYPSKYLLGKGCYMPSVDLVDMFLRLAQKYGMKFWFGLYDSGRYWDTGDLSWEIEDNKYVIDEVWQRYGHYESFGGWSSTSYHSDRQVSCSPQRRRRARRSRCGHPGMRKHPPRRVCRRKSRSTPFRARPHSLHRHW